MSIIIPSPYSIARNHISLPITHSKPYTAVWARNSDNILRQAASEGVKAFDWVVAWADQEEEIYDDGDFAQIPPLYYELHWRNEWYMCPVDPIPLHFSPDKWRRTYPCKLRCRRVWLTQNCQILPMPNDDSSFYFDFSKAKQMWLAPHADCPPSRALEYTRPYSTPYGDIEGFSFDEVVADWGHVFSNIVKPTGHLRQKIANNLIDEGNIPDAWEVENPFLICGVKFIQPTKYIITSHGPKKVPDEDEVRDYDYVVTHKPDYFMYWNEPASPAEGGWGNIENDVWLSNYLYEQLSNNLGRPLIEELGIGKAFDFWALNSNYYRLTWEKRYDEAGFDPNTKTMDFRANRFEFSFRQLKKLPPQ